LSSAKTAYLLAAGTAVAMGILYVRFIWVVVTAYLVPFTLVEVLVLSTMLIRVSCFLLIPALRRAKPFLVFDLLSVEVLALPLLALGSIVTESRLYDALGLQLLVSWVFAILLCGPSVLLSRLTRALLSGVRLSVALPSAAAIFAVLWSFQGVSATPQGVTGPISLIVAYFGGVSPSSTLVVASPVIAVAGILAFISVGLYTILADGRGGRTRLQPLFALLLGVGGTLAWVAGLSALTSSSILILSVPTTAVVGLIWWVSHES
jgi:hypothetical protein